MALTNFTEDENQKTFIELFCLAEFIRGVDTELIFLSALNIFLSITAFLGNTLILVALYKETSLHPPSKLLYRNLAITDLCVGIIVEPLHVTYWTSVVKERWDICYYSLRTGAFSGYTLCVVSALTLTAISVDRLLALLLGLRYRRVVTLRRTSITVIGFWILSIVGASTFIWNLLIFTWYQYIVAAFCLVTTIFAYTKIFCTLRHNQIHFQNHVAQGQPSQAIPALNIARYRKAVYSALWVQGTFVVCYLPVTIAAALMPQRGIPISAYRAWHFTATLVYLNSSLNPLLYSWKISEVREAVKETLRQLLCRSS
ncbi:melanocyte-stimulating hormone receptor-like [Porites lutea]|uniref:melanocyte-stimulating hormone receptor-like n=1 Tax=Porites lutea TaxID=51062 RepID=UPI003CC691F6